MIVRNKFKAYKPYEKRIENVRSVPYSARKLSYRTNRIASEKRVRNVQLVLHVVRFRVGI